ncbi:LysR family transcriptional regulator [Pleomorphomonas diazotrophica]|uniref:LysR family transcriptional regulator n=1 Tax=Pleomorphomonas diazotrophica TaxID=1166257 RepID=A0A1I4QPD1_9HYPH|nr:LysR family transcriptional regulator [Pleomorphomonas diazotrophica]PKR90537.1 LysR family transcriptional regulator [Pleomorphomonas diazotrophica]SFM41570.1 DNA-binding transcriptional regulator, LysR family [Pleomorphomonas diazotrophica]
MRDSLDDIAVFVEAAEAGGFAAGAARLNLTRSAVGKAVARLEARLGVRLFHRTTRLQSLTEDGEAFFHHCRRALAEIRAGHALIETGRQAVSGRLRVSVPLSFGRRCVAPILLALARRHQGLSLEIDFSDRPVDLVEEGFDLSVRTGRIGDSGSLMARLLMRQRMMLVAAPDYLERRGTPASLEDLALHDCIVYRRQGRNERWRFPDESGGLRELVVDGRIGADDIETINEAALSGFGIAYLPCWLVQEEVTGGRLVGLLTSSTEGRRADIHAVWPKAPYLPTRVRAAIDALAAELPGRAVPQAQDVRTGANLSTILL